MEWAIEKCTELGVSHIIPVIARRTDAHLASAASKRVERWRKIVLQAAEQSRRASPPEIADPAKLKEAANHAASLRLLLTESEKRTSLRDVFGANDDVNAIALAVGPEGGWTDDELHLFQQNGWISATLGPTILRAETAAIAATAICISELNR
jgi:16S rRNA (uracil1498-N3)-methyltransferase